MGRLFIVSILFLIAFGLCNNGIKGSENKTGSAITFADGGKTDYVIKVSPDDLVANTAAKELAQYLKEVTGADLSITGIQDSAGKPFIAVGPGAAKKFFPDQNIDFTKLGDDGIVIKTIDGNLLLTGAEGAQRGTLYAVYEFLENTVGIHWWTSTETYVPHKKTLTIPELNTVYVPKLLYRDTFYLDTLPDGKFAARLKCNAHYNNIPAGYGGKHKILGWCHTFYPLLPPEKYFKDHPEWYSEKDKKRSSDFGSQLCLSNDEMRKELTKNALEWLRKHPEADMISISQNDGCRIKNGCDCAKCLALAKQEDSPSGPLIKFINQVAEDIEKEFPKVRVETLAYTYTLKPPKTLKPRKNVVIFLCIQTLKPEDFSKKVQDWSLIAPGQLLLCYYTADFKDYIQIVRPDIIEITAKNIRHLAKNDLAFGMMLFGDHGCNCGDFVQLRAWVFAHLLWNPDLDEHTLIKKFMYGYYGDAAKPLMDYLELLNRSCATDSLFKLKDNEQEFFKEAFNLYEKAIALVKKDPVLNRRVRRAKMSLEWTYAKLYNQLKFKAKSEGKPFTGPSKQEMASLCKNFVSSAHEFKIKDYGEDNKFSNVEKGFLARFNSSKPEICKDLSDDEWIDIPASDLGYWKPGLWVNFVDDEKSSSGRVPRMPGNISEWAVYYNVPGYISALEMRAYVAIRCNLSNKTDLGKTAFNAGFCDKVSGKVSSISVPVKQITDGEYHTYDLGIYDLKNGYIWVAPAKNSDVEGVYTDRIFFVKDNKTTNKE